MLETITRAAGEAYGVTEFTTSLMSAAQGALPYIGAGVGAGALIFALTLGIRKGLGALRSVAK